MAERRFSEDEPVMVSIRCITYNHAPYIRQCLEGFVMQKTNFRFQAIVHDDASTDGTTDIVREYAEKYPDIIIPMYEKENRWSKHDGSLLTVMLPYLKGKYIAECEGDDYWTDPLKLQKQYDALETHPDCTICFCKVGVVTKTDSSLSDTIPTKGFEASGIVSLKDFIKNEYGKGRWSFQSSCFFMRREYYMGGNDSREFFSHFPYSDQPQILWCLLHGQGYYINERCGNYRIFSGGFTSQSHSTRAVGIKRERDLYMALDFLDKYTFQKYHKYIKKKQLLIESNIDYFSKNKIGLLSPKYLKTIGAISLRRFTMRYLYIFCEPLHKFLMDRHFR